LGDRRREAGRERAPFEVIVALTTPPDIDTFRRLEDQGVTGVVSWPLVSSIAQKRGALESYANQIIRHFR
jgi:hypothetical protein